MNESDAGELVPLDLFLAEARAKAESGSPGSVTIRGLLRHINAERRGTRVVDQLQRALDAHGLVTDPPFTSGWIDNEVALRLAPTASLVEDEEGQQPEGTTAGGPPAEVGLTVGSLQSATAGVVTIERNSDLPRARALMLRYNYSQLAVMAGERRLVGATSWESMAMAAIRRQDFSLGDATVQATQVEPTDDLIALIPTIADSGFIFVVGRDRKLTGIVTTADLSSQFAALAKPFFLVGEIERRLRQILSARFNLEELASVQDPADTDREIVSAHDLTLGETLRFLEDVPPPVELRDGGPCVTAMRWPA